MAREDSLKAIFAALFVGFVAGFGVAHLPTNRAARQLDDARRATARAQCERWADKLDRDTTDTGVYVRHAGDTLPEDDPWGRPLRVSYSQGGLAEHLEVRSVGADGESHTADDVTVSRQSVNLKGVGSGVKTGAEETAANAARGAVKGTADGVKKALGLGSKPADGK